MKPLQTFVFSRDTLISAVPVVVALMLSGLISFGYNFLLKDYRDSVDHTFLVLSKIDSALLRFQDAETGQRGFIITGDEAYLAPFVAAERQVFRELADLDGLVSDNAEQKARLASLQQLANAKLNELHETIERRREDGFERARMSVLGNTGKETMDRIRSITGEMRDKEHLLLEARLTDARTAERLMLLVAAIGFALSLGGRMAAWIIRSRMRATAPHPRGSEPGIPA